MTSRGGIPRASSPGVGNFGGCTERNVRMQLTDTQDAVAATVRRSITRIRAPANKYVSK